MANKSFKYSGYKNPHTTRDYAGSFINEICENYNKEKDKEKDKKRNKNIKDTELRKRIQRKIEKLINYNFPKDQIVICLKHDFPNSKYEEFFESWVENQLRKKKKEDMIKRDDIESFR